MLSVLIVKGAKSVFRQFQTHERGDKGESMPISLVGFDYKKNLTKSRRQE